VQYSCSNSPGTLSVSSRIEKNGFKPCWNSTQLTIFGLAASPTDIRLGEQLLKDWRYDTNTHSVTLTLPDAISDWTVKLSLQ
jgi:hypothetical protein